MNSDQSRIAELKRKISEADHMYHVMGTPIMADSEYDKMKQELRSLEEKYGTSTDSPTMTVGALDDSEDGFQTVEHFTPMLSLENAFTEADLKRWIVRIKDKGVDPFPLHIEPKIDGMSGSLIYNKNSFLERAVTRGDGKRGDIITANALRVKGIQVHFSIVPSVESSESVIEVRGEFYIPKSTLERVNKEREQEGLEPLKNCRNAVVGSMKSLDPNIVAQRGVQFLAYQIISDVKIQDQQNVLSILKRQGFETPWYVTVFNFKELINTVEDLYKKRKDNDYDIDGLVIKVLDLKKQKELGANRIFPLWAIAWKFPQEKAITKLKNVVWQVGRDSINPVAELVPVDLEGTTVSRASLHNIDVIQNKDIRIGDFVEIEKAAYIIPYILRSIPEKRTGEERKIEFPSTCPSCNSPTKINRECKVPILQCTNDECGDSRLRKTLHFIKALEIEEIGPGLLEKLIDKNLIKMPTDLFYLTPQSLKSVDRIGEKTVQKIIANISKARQNSLARIILSLGIPSIGMGTAEKLANYFQSFQAFVNCKESLEDLKIPGVGHKVAVDYRTFAQKNRLFIEELLKNVTVISTTSASNSAISGKNFVLTGEATKSRSELTKFIKKFGGIVQSGVNKNTHYLVVGSKESAGYSSNKTKNAEKFGVKRIDEFILEKLV